jgi:hypothetical protein
MAVVWAHYLGACVSPRPVLSCDWSGPSIPLVTSLNPQQDPRLFGVFAMGAAALCVLITGWVSRRRENARAGIKIAIGVRLHACAAFYVFPFLLSSNIFVVTGTTVAERVVYLPSLGVCMGYGLLASGWLDGESVWGDVSFRNAAQSAADYGKVDCAKYTTCRDGAKVRRAQLRVVQSS